MKNYYYLPTDIISGSHDHLMMLCSCSVAFLGPSITPYINIIIQLTVFMKWRVYMTIQLIGHHVYFFNLTTANSENNATWQYLYGAKVSGSGDHVI